MQPSNIYIGRRCFKIKDFGHIQICYLYGNPYTVRKYGTLGAIYKYIEHLIGNVPILYKLANLIVTDKFQQLQIGCWCYPYPCHGQILKYLLEYC